MPIFDFYCSHCDLYSEHLVKTEDHSPKFCDSCSNKLEKVFLSAPNFKVKEGKGLQSHSFRRGIKEKFRIPINVVDVNDDGSYKVTSTSKDPELVNG